MTPRVPMTPKIRAQMRRVRQAMALFPETIPLTPAMRTAIVALERAEDTYVPGRDSSAAIELPKLQLADSVRQSLRRAAKLPARARRVAWVRSAPRRKRA